MRQKSMKRRKPSAKKWFLVLAILLGSSMLATAVAPDQNREVYGSWVMMDVEQAGMHIYSTLTIRPDRVDTLTRCSFGGKQIEANATTPAQITENKITITEGNQVEKCFVFQMIILLAIPFDILVSIFGSLHIVDICRSARISKTFKLVSQVSIKRIRDVHFENEYNLLDVLDIIGHKCLIDIIFQFFEDVCFKFQIIIKSYYMITIRSSEFRFQDRMMPSS